MFCKKCHLYNSQHYESIIYTMKIPIDILHIIIVGFIRRTRVIDVLFYIKDNYPKLHFNIQTIYKYFSKFRKLITFYTYEVLKSVHLDGEWEIDEALITSKKKDGRGRAARFRLWAFGLYSRKLSLPIIYLVPNRKKITLHPIIDRFIDRGSTIYSDEFKTYVNTRASPRQSIIENNLAHKEYTHLWTNHKFSFVNKYDHSIHTNSIESSWKNLRTLTRRKLTMGTVKYFIGEFNFRHLIKREVEQFNILLLILSKAKLIQ